MNTKPPASPITRFDIHATPIAGLWVLHRNPIGDERGYLERLFCADELHAVIAGKPIVQINHTLTTTRGTVRGLHFQFPPYAETKLVSCIKGEVFDVAVDLRHNSPTFLRWHGEILSADNHKTFVIPEGFAHGFQTLTDHCEMLYFHTSVYRADAEGGLNTRDPSLAIQWPLPVINMSARDESHPMLNDQFPGIA
jgi:dTDP-4-dehydrorhamnose 3,5-epimerase